MIRPGIGPRIWQRFLRDRKSQAAVASSPNPVGAYLFTGRLGITESQLGSFQLGEDRIQYFGATLTPSDTMSIPSVSNLPGEYIILQPRHFSLGTQGKPSQGVSIYGISVYGEAFYADNSPYLEVQPRQFTLSVQSTRQGSEG